jgi:hypothetical protein
LFASKMDRPALSVEGNCNPKTQALESEPWGTLRVLVCCEIQRSGRLMQSVAKNDSSGPAAHFIVGKMEIAYESLPRSADVRIR